MPNHESNYVMIVGTAEKISRILGECLTDNNPDKPGEPLTLDFDKIRPMPRELRETVSPADVVDTEEEAAAINAKYAARPLFPGDEQKIKAITRAEHRRRLRDYGATDWYDWSVNNWGTKWGAYSPERCEVVPLPPSYIDEKYGDVQLQLIFDTAWTQPAPIFDAIAEKYEVLVLAITIDEGGQPPERYSSDDEVDVSDGLQVVTSVEFQS